MQNGSDRGMVEDWRDNLRLLFLANCNGGADFSSCVVGYSELIAAFIRHMSISWRETPVIIS